ncbi:hypothetical protein LCGC14_2627380, partial [marine sediment metagenome]
TMDKAVGVYEKVSVIEQSYQDFLKN